MSPENSRVCHHWFRSRFRSRSPWFLSKCPWFLCWCAEFGLLRKDPWSCRLCRLSHCEMNHGCAGCSSCFGLRGSGGCRFFVDHKLCKKIEQNSNFFHIRKPKQKQNIRSHNLQ